MGEGWIEGVGKGGWVKKKKEKGGGEGEEERLKGLGGSVCLCLGGFLCD